MISRYMPCFLIIVLAACAVSPPPPVPTPNNSQQQPEDIPLVAPDSPPAPTAAPTAVPDPTPLLARWGDGTPLAAAYMPDGTTIVLATGRSLELRAVNDPGQTRWWQALDQQPRGLAVSADGATIALATATGIMRFRASDGSPIDTLAPDLNCLDVALAPDGSALAALTDERIVVLDPNDGAALAELIPGDEDPIDPPGPFTTLDFSPDGQLIASGDLNGNVIVWRRDGSIAQTFSVGLRVIADIAFSPDNRTLAAASEGWRSEPGAAWLWDLPSSSELRWLTLNPDTSFQPALTRLAFAPGGNELAVGDLSGLVLRWSLSDGSLRGQSNRHQAAISALSYAPDGGALLSAGRDGLIRIAAPDGASRAEIERTPALQSLAAAADGGMIAVGGIDGSLRLTLADGTLRRLDDGHLGAVHALVISADDRLLISAGADGVVQTLALPENTPQQRISAHDGAALALALSPDGTAVASAGDDGYVRIWRLRDGELQREIKVLESDGISATNIPALAWAPDGTIAAGVYAGEIRRYAADKQLESVTIADGGWVMSLAYSGDSVLAALDDTGSVTIWRGTRAGPRLNATGVADLRWAGDRLVGGGEELMVWSSGSSLEAIARRSNLTIAGIAPAGAGRIAVIDQGGYLELRTIP
ncbi:MAG: WD40 repeat domain-containing protein [Oscillochloris sp.]|nr:WD40 repeat domain-containing protein [Oscillochloris sp.]